MAEFDLDEIRAYREREVWGNGFRKPHCYGLLTSFEVKEPFVRAKARSRTRTTKVKEVLNAEGIGIE